MMKQSGITLDKKAIRKSAEDPKNHKREEITLVIKKGMRKKRGLVDISML